MKSVLIAMVMAAAPAAAQTAIDGDTIKLDGTTFRLWGIDAMESRQACADGWAGGREATGYLAGLMRGRVIACEARAVDRYGRTVAMCRADGEDLGAAMVSAGMALAFRRYSVDYIEQEAAAKAAGLGLHAHDCLPAWEWRAQRRQ